MVLPFPAWGLTRVKDFSHTLRAGLRQARSRGSGRSTVGRGYTARALTAMGDAVIMQDGN